MQQHCPLTHLEEGYLNAFVLATTAKERNELLVRHEVFWNQDGIERRVGAQALPAIAQHISHWAIRAQSLSDTEINSLPHRGGLWQYTHAWMKWQRRIAEERHQLDWNCIETYIRQIIDVQLARSKDKPKTEMLIVLEEAMAQGMQWTVHELIHVVGANVKEHPIPKRFFVQWPHIQALFLNPDNVEALQALAVANPWQLHWLQHLHPSINAWNLAERCTTVVELEWMCGTIRDNALFKAWHGIALTLDEIQRYPKAQSLYVHKHAPALGDEVVPLPENWRLAMEMATTGAQFKAFILQALSGKTEESLELPTSIVN